MKYQVVLPTKSVVENERLTGFEYEVFGEVVIVVRQDVLNLGGIADDLGIAGHIEGRGFRGAIEDGKRRMALILTSDDIDAVIGDELDLFALRNNLISLSPMEQTREPLEHALLSF